MVQNDEIFTSTTKYDAYLQEEPLYENSQSWIKQIIQHVLQALGEGAAFLGFRAHFSKSFHTHGPKLFDINLFASLTIATYQYA